MRTSPKMLFAPSLENYREDSLSFKLELMGFVCCRVLWGSFQGKKPGVVPQQGIDLAWISLRAPRAAGWILAPVITHSQELPLRGLDVTEVICTGGKAGVELRRGKRTPEAFVERGRGAAVPWHSSAGAIHGLGRPLLAPAAGGKRPGW